jgi:hypothetical protein
MLHLVNCMVIVEADNAAEAARTVEGHLGTLLDIAFSDIRLKVVGTYTPSGTLERIRQQ